VERKLGHKVSSHLIHHTAKKCGIVNPFGTSLTEAQQCYEECNREYAALKKRAPDLCLEFLQSLASNESGEVDSASQKAARHLLRTERQRLNAWHFRQVLGNTQGGAIARIEVMEGNGLLEVSTQADVEHHTMAMCAACFRLSEDTPPMIEPLRGELGFLGTTAVARQILAGTYEPPPDVDNLTWEFFLLFRLRHHLIQLTVFLVKSPTRTFNTIGGRPRSTRRPPSLACIMATTRQQPAAIY
jgi:hypothetical protein